MGKEIVEEMIPSLITGTPEERIEKWKAYLDGGICIIDPRENKAINVMYSSSNLPNLESISQGVCTIASTSIDIYEDKELINVNVFEDRVELTYVERTYLAGHPPVRVFKRIYKYDGKLMPSPEVVYGEVIPASEERYEF